MIEVQTFTMPNVICTMLQNNCLEGFPYNADKIEVDETFEELQCNIKFMC